MDNDPNFSIGYDSVYFYQGVPFTGIMKSVHPNGIIRVTEMKEGKEDGRTYDTYLNGQLAAEYFYRNGKSIGVHKGWYEDGKPRFEFSYDEEGLSDGDHWEWHEEGNPYRYGRFEKGNLIGQKVWRKDGKIFANYSYTSERLYGVLGSKLCFKLKGDETNQKTVIR
ncbi:membrane-binding protein [Leptospira idonii]|uniref:Membrane-binding protein n=2 Tax=Leptospira idonii TaxID=1193500 RepID=A0A4R9LUU2_9LEPT|nr:membrane-binding protein [Leptospira idonii]